MENTTNKQPPGGGAEEERKAQHESERKVARNGFLNPSGDEEKMYRALDQIAQLKNVIDNHPGYELPEIPQIIVCGSQSAGKSSVLETLTGIAFPRKKGLCTRYPTKVTIERSNENSVHVDITASAGRSKYEAQQSNIGIPETVKWEDWEEKGTSIVERWVTVANTSILGPDWERKESWEKDVLTITIKHEEKRPLQVVDLPGLIFHTIGRPTAADDVVEVVTTEMQKPNCVILAVVDGTDDRNKHRILDYCKEFDPHGERTIVVVTKL
jgi:GTP-binding protein EngB required for normal cell division